MTDDAQNPYSLSDEEREAEAKWNELFADPRSHRLLSKMAEEARKEDEAGETKSLKGFLHM